MIQRAVIFTQYSFIPAGGSDWLEGHHSTMERVLGIGIVHFNNKRGGVLMMMFVGDLRCVKKAEILYLIEQKCQLKFIGQEEVKYKIEFEQTLKRIYGDSLVVK